MCLGRYIFDGISLQEETLHTLIAVATHRVYKHVYNIATHYCKAWESSHQQLLDISGMLVTHVWHHDITQVWFLIVQMTTLFSLCRPVWLGEDMICFEQKH